MDGCRAAALRACDRSRRSGNRLPRSRRGTFWELFGSGPRSRAVVCTARPSGAFPEAGTRQSGTNRVVARAARRRAGTATAGGNDRRTRPDRRRAARRARALALRRSNPAAGRANSRGARGGERTDANGDRARRRARQRRAPEWPPSRRRAARRGAACVTTRIARASPSTTSSIAHGGNPERRARRCRR